MNIQTILDPEPPPPGYRFLHTHETLKLNDLVYRCYFYSYFTVLHTDFYHNHTQIVRRDGKTGKIISWDFCDEKITSWYFDQRRQPLLYSFATKIQHDMPFWGLFQ